MSDIIVLQEPEIVVDWTTKEPALPADPFDMLAGWPNKGPTALLSLRRGDCKWPIGDIHEPGFHFCRQPRQAIPGKDGERMLPYCPEHCRIAYGGRKG
jgi:GcrA cell cycle regulator